MSRRKTRNLESVSKLSNLAAEPSIVDPAVEHVARAVVAEAHRALKGAVTLLTKAGIGAEVKARRVPAELPSEARSLLADLSMGAGQTHGVPVIALPTSAEVWDDLLSAPPPARRSGKGTRVEGVQHIGSVKWPGCRQRRRRFSPRRSGIGAYYAQTGSSDVHVGGNTFTVGGGSSGSLAWGGIAGVDYYWTPQISTFVEYNYLEYVALDVGDGGHRFGQQLIGGGFRWHFCPPVW